MKCSHKSDSNVCAIATQLAGRNVVPWENVCETCSTCKVPQQINYVTASIAAHVHEAIDPNTAAKLRRKFVNQGLFEIGRPEPEPIPGVGSELKKLLLSIDIIPKFDCDCESLLREMNRLGVEGCKRERERLVADLKLNAHHYTWIDRIRAARRVAQSELVLRIDITDPIGWLFDEAVRRYEVIELGAKKDV